VQIAVFARAPVAGAVKTRLIPRLGADGAARLHEQLVQRTLATACAVAGARVTLWIAGDPAHPGVVQWAARHPVALRAQCDGDLGARMLAAFRAAGGALVLIGTDCPALAGADLVAAAAGLAAHDAVLQPAEDGGYVLIALRAPCAALFDGIGWGGAQVMADTRRRARAAGLRLSERPPLPDLDTPQDYDRAVQSGWLAPVA